MLDTVTTVVVALLGVHIIVKFAFFALPYRKRRAALGQELRWQAVGDNHFRCRHARFHRRAGRSAAVARRRSRQLPRRPLDRRDCDPAVLPSFPPPGPSGSRSSPANVAAEGDVVRDPGLALAAVATDAGAGRARRVEPGLDHQMTGAPTVETMTTDAHRSRPLRFGLHTALPRGTEFSTFAISVQDSRF